jgi:putative oxidoreductase
VLKTIRLYDDLTAWLSSKLPESVMLVFVRIALAGIFWRSGRTKVDEGSWLTISDTTRTLFEEDYSAVPLPTELATYMATYAEHLFPILLVIGLFTRLSALALLGMTIVIQIFVFPDAWWPLHSLWVALALVLIVRGGGLFSLDRILPKAQRR